LFREFSDEEIKDPLTKVEVTERSYSISREIRQVKSEAALDMMILENEFFRVLVSNILEIIQDSELKDNINGAIFIDGPIVDPPMPSLSFKEKYSEYVSDRIRGIMEAISGGIYPIGYIKRIIGSMYTSYVAAKYNINQIKSVDDYTFTTLLFYQKYRVISELALNSYDIIVYTKPQELDPTNIKAYPDYVKAFKTIKRSGGDLRVFYSLVWISAKRNPRIKMKRIEVPILGDVNETEVNKIFRDLLKVIYLWHLGALPHPLPVILAHSLCTIRKSIAKVVSKEISTSFVSKKIRDINDFLKYYLLKRW